MIESLAKIKAAVSTLENWPLAIADKLGLVSAPLYRTRTGLVFACRGGTNDVNQIVAVLSGFEYPLELLKVSPGSIVMDIGAHVGSFSAAVSVVSGKNFRGLAVEPSPGNFALLQRNLKANRLDNISSIQAAAAALDGTANLDVSGNPNAYAVTAGAGVAVPSKRISTLAKDSGFEKIDLMKMDIEGAEYEVFDADYDFLAKHVSTLILEYHARPGKSAEALLARLQKDFEVQILHTSPSNGVVHAVNKFLTAAPEKITA